MFEIEIKTTKHCVFVDITGQINMHIPSNFCGLCNIFCCHTTAGLTVNENADPDVKNDIITALEEKFPWRDSIYCHAEGNSAAHIKASLLGFSLTLPVANGKLDMGQWQAVYLCEFDGPRTRTLKINFLS